ncbi:Nep1-domain-containing protein [Microstroma glucosiphilum]|uniref:Nep1-domain-containing protein n=1 Tax=Pseudomicrostroma glucosiphilum TaxID=1684307 RepID=A0A316UEN6_9BASI|nr:Nep1-domain-containing protein [Pseudomicrostroma glucosiphilum]PWN23689.1 Nep1-domain-containing protein [Pseudomicrostroma glucosiphilum]
MSSSASSSSGRSVSPEASDSVRAIKPLPAAGASSSSASPPLKSAATTTSSKYSFRPDAQPFSPAGPSTTAATAPTGRVKHALPPKPSTSYSAPANGAKDKEEGIGAKSGLVGEDEAEQSAAASSSISSSKRLRVDPSLVPLQPKLSKSAASSSTPPQRLIVVLEQACLETYKMSSSGSSGNSRGHSKGGDDKYVLLNCDDHQRVLARMGRDIAEARPDITHQCLLTLLDSPLNKAGMLQVYIHTAKGVLIEVNPQIRIPRTFKRFGGLMVQLLQKLSIRSVNGPEKLLKVIKNPVVDHFPPGTHKITLSYDAPLRRLSSYLPTLLPSSDAKDAAPRTLAVFIGAMAHGKDDFADQYGLDEKMSVSEYSLSASVACGKFCCAMEDIWNVA